jgi:hypothetical protein
MKLTLLVYRRLAIFLWGSVLAVAGWSSAYYLQWGQRKAIFTAVLAAGAYALFMRQKVNAERQDALVAAKEPTEKVIGNNDYLVGEPRQVIVEKASPDKQISGKTTGEGRNKLMREKLDEFLFIQQDR